MSDICSVHDPVRHASAREEWRAIWWADGYEVSSMFRVRSWKTIGSKMGRLDETPRLVRVKHHPRTGKLEVQLSIDGKHSGSSVARLVAEAFLGRCPSQRHEAAMLDGDASNLRLDNVGWRLKVENPSRHINAAVSKKLSALPVDQRESAKRMRARVRAARSEEELAALRDLAWSAHCKRALCNSSHGYDANGSPVEAP